MTNLELIQDQKSNKVIKDAINTAIKYHSEGNLKQASQIYEEILKIDSQNSIVLHLKGVIAFQCGKNDQAIALIAKSIVINPDYSEAYNNLGNVFKVQKKLQQALVCFEKAIKLNPDYSEAYNNLGIVFFENKQIESAILFCKKAISLNPNYSEAYFNIGNFLKKQKLIDDAIYFYNQAISINPNYIEAIMNLANCFFEIGDYDDAITNYQKLIRINPNIPESFLNIGLIMIGKGKLESSIIYLEKSLKLNPKLSLAHFNLGNVYKELDNYETAIKYYNLAIDVSPKNVNAYINKALIYKNLDDFDNAVQMLEKALTIQPNGDNEDIHNHILHCYFFKGDISKFSEKLNNLIKSGYNNALMGSLCSRANIKYDLDRTNPFCKYPMKYITTKQLGNEYDFYKIFVKNIENIINNQKKYHSTVIDFNKANFINGHQTLGNIFLNVEESVLQIKKVILKEVEEYKNIFKNSDEPFIQNWPTQIELNGWVVQMRSGGSIRPHMHNKGWLSGSIYINVPKLMKKNEGNLGLCIEEKNNIKNKDEFEEKIINVETGTLCLFPSSLLHYSFPFVSNENRIVLAFDLVRK